MRITEHVQCPRCKDERGIIGTARRWLYISAGQRFPTTVWRCPCLTYPDRFTDDELATIAASRCITESDE